MTDTIEFFKSHAGFSVRSDETTEQGADRSARELAQAEEYAKREDWTFSWEDDWSLGMSHADYYGPGSVYENQDREPHSCESCILRDRHGDILASLGCVDDADQDYHRVVEAELALEAMPDGLEDQEIEYDDRDVRFIEDPVESKLPRGWATCGTCGRAWDDERVTSWTPAPAGRCPFEYDHQDDDE